ncbi:MAG: Maf family nucleotide pyrophosphatase [Burkholderiales bacterium]
MRLILASTSPYRRELLARLGLPFETAAPAVDETPRPGEAPRVLALRLAEAKARAVGTGRQGALVIGSDQVADLDGAPLGKPGTHDRAVAQLRQLRGRRADFHTALAMLNAGSGLLQTGVVTVRVHFRDYSDAQIERYLLREQPYDCAGSAKVEGLGIALLAAVDSDDPTALIGLPLIRLTAMLAAEGIEVP